MKRFQDYDFRQMEKWLAEYGFTETKLVDDQGNLTDVIGAIFENEDGEKYYLVYLDLKRYAVEYTTTPKPMDVANKIAYVPEFARDFRRRRYFWVPRKLSDKPQAFGTQSAAEHLGVAVSTIKEAIHGRGKIKNADVIGHVAILDTQSLLDWTNTRQNIGKPAGHRMQPA